jgi:hypothetical protein
MSKCNIHFVSDSSLSTKNKDPGKARKMNMKKEDDSEDDELLDM